MGSFRTLYAFVSGRSGVNEKRSGADKSVLFGKRL